MWREGREVNGPLPWCREGVDDIAVGSQNSGNVGQLI